MKYRRKLVWNIEQRKQRLKRRRTARINKVCDWMIMCQHTSLVTIVFQITHPHQSFTHLIHAVNYYIST